MSQVIDPKKVLIDVISLSKRSCKYPIQGKLAYATSENFLGRIVAGYYVDAAHICLLTIKTSQALCAVQNELNEAQLGLFIFDAYRPLRAVKDFAKWFHAPIADSYELERKQIHYPNLEKPDLVTQGYAPDTLSMHNFGHTVDLTLLDLNTQHHFDMGTCFDYFDELSHSTATAEQISVAAVRNRLLLKDVMIKHGFVPYEKEFWHFSYHVKEVEKPMDIPITKDLEGLNVLQGSLISKDIFQRLSID